MDIAALFIGVFGVGSLAIAFAKYTIAKRKIIQHSDYAENNFGRF